MVVCLSEVSFSAFLVALWRLPQPFWVSHPHLYCFPCLCSAQSSTLSHSWKSAYQSPALFLSQHTVLSMFQFALVSPKLHLCTAATFCRSEFYILPGPCIFQKYGQTQPNYGPSTVLTRWPAGYLGSLYVSSYCLRGCWHLACGNEGFSGSL